MPDQVTNPQAFRMFEWLRNGVLQRRNLTRPVHPQRGMAMHQLLDCMFDLIKRCAWSSLKTK